MMQALQVGSWGGPISPVRFRLVPIERAVFESEVSRSSVSSVYDALRGELLL